MCDIVRIECSLILKVIVMPQQPVSIDALTFNQILEKVAQLNAAQTEQELDTLWDQLKGYGDPLMYLNYLERKIYFTIENTGSLQEQGTVVTSYHEALLCFVKALGIARIYATSDSDRHKAQGIEHLNKLTGALLETLSQAIEQLPLKSILIDHSTAAMLSMDRLLTIIERELPGTTYADKLDEFLKMLISIAQTKEN